MALLLVAGVAAAQPSLTCQDWQNKFQRIHATWQANATRQIEVENAFGAPTRIETNGPCSSLQYTVAGCSSSFTVCSQQRVVSKTLVVGAGAVPAFLPSDPAPLAEAIDALAIQLKLSEERIAEFRKIVERLAPPPSPPSILDKPLLAAAKPLPKPPPPPCAASTKKGVRCTRRAEEGSPYCWQHRR